MVESAGLRVFLTEVEITRLILNDLRKTNRPFLEEDIVIPVVTYARDLAAQRVATALEFPSGSFLRPELVDRSRRDGQALAGREAHDLAGSEDSRAGIDLDWKIIVRPSAFGRGLGELDENVSAVAADDVLALRAVEVCGSALVLGIDEKLLGVGFRVARIVRAAVAQGEKNATNVFKLSTAEVGDIPTEHAVADFVVLGPRFVPLIKRPMTVRRQGEMEMFRDLDSGAEAFVNRGACEWHCRVWSFGRLQRTSAGNNVRVL